MSFLFSGSGGQTQQTQQQTQSTASTSYPDWYQSYVQNILNTAQNLGSQPYQAYDVNKMFAPFSADQQQAFNQIRNNQTAYQPYVQAGTTALNNVSGYDPFQQGMPYIQRAAAGPTALQAGAPGVQASMQGWNNPAVQSGYMDPYLGGAIGYAQQLAGQNFAENTLPQINNAFIKSGGGGGGERYQEFMNRATRDFNNASLGQGMTMANQGYWNAANQFNQDQSRLQSGGLGMGQLANTTMGALGNLGQQAAGITSGAVNTGVGLAGAYSNLGGALSNLNLTNTNALLQSGALQQQQAQLPLTAQYQQFQQGIQWPYQMVNFMNAASRGLQIPQTMTSDQTTNRYSMAGSTQTPSLMSSILGTALGGLNLYGQANKIFGGGGTGNTGGSDATGSPVPDSSGNNAFWNQVSGQMNAGDQQAIKKGGYIRGYRKGGKVRFDDGGCVGATQQAPDPPAPQYATPGMVAQPGQIQAPTGPDATTQPATTAPQPGGVLRGFGRGFGGGWGGWGGGMGGGMGWGGGMSPMMGFGGMGMFNPYQMFGMGMKKGGPVRMAQGGPAFGAIVSPIGIKSRRGATAMAAGGIPPATIGVNGRPSRRARGALSGGPGRPMPPGLPGMLNQAPAMAPAMGNAMGNAMPPPMPGMQGISAPRPRMARGGALGRMR